MILSSLWLSVSRACIPKQYSNTQHGIWGIFTCLCPHKWAFLVTPNIQLVEHLFVSYSKWDLWKITDLLISISTQFSYLKSESESKSGRINVLFEVFCSVSARHSNAIKSLQDDCWHGNAIQTYKSKFLTLCMTSNSLDTQFCDSLTHRLVRFDHMSLKQTKMSYNLFKFLVL